MYFEKINRQFCLSRAAKLARKPKSNILMAELNDVADYIIARVKSEGNESLSTLKLQKLMYYCQAWHLAFKGNPLFDGKFQAWIHGPVNRRIYDRFKDTKAMFSEIEIADIITPEPQKKLSANEIRAIDIVLDTYLKYSDIQLEISTHQEDPWIEARGGLSPTARCENDISEDTMKAYYGARIKKG